MCYLCLAVCSSFESSLSVYFKNECAPLLGAGGGTLFLKRYFEEEITNGVLRRLGLLLTNCKV